MKRSLALFSVSWQRAIAYRGASGIFVLLSFLNIWLAILVLSIAMQKPLMHAQETFSGIVSYFVVVTVLVHLVLCRSSESVAERYIKRGELSLYLLKPYPFLLYILISDIPWRITQFVFSLVPVGVLMLLFRVHLTIGARSLGIALLLLPIAYSVSFLIEVGFGMLAFWFEDAHGYLSLLEVFILLFTGISLPLSLFPPVLSALSALLPFQYILYFPVSVLLNRAGAEQITWGVIALAVWLAILTVGVRLMWQKGLRQFTAEGI